MQAPLHQAPALPRREAISQPSRAPTFELPSCLFSGPPSCGRGEVVIDQPGEGCQKTAPSPSNSAPTGPQTPGSPQGSGTADTEVKASLQTCTVMLVRPELLLRRMLQRAPGLQVGLHSRKAPCGVNRETPSAVGASQESLPSEDRVNHAHLKTEGAGVASGKWVRYFLPEGMSVRCFPKGNLYLPAFCFGDWSF